MTWVEAGSIAAIKSVVDSLPKPLHEWDSPLNILSEESSPRLALAHQQLSCPVLVNYRGGWFLAERFDPESADRWFEQDKASVASVEAMLNHIHLQNYTFGDGRPDMLYMTEQEAMACGHRLAYQWKNWARDIYNLSIKVFLIKNSDENPDIQIWFESQGLLS
ncbi:MAG: hypothetical protein NVV72_02170 [Asticcacaulis sp.]|nr:hypothetical protein [Asticcacaulis sp.]